MYNAVFEADNGRKYVFGVDGETAFDMDIGNGVTVDIGKSQGFLQVGETVENFTVTGRPIEVKGVIYGDVAKKKREMRGVFAPFVSGKLTVQGKYYIRVYVQEINVRIIKVFRQVAYYGFFVRQKHLITAFCEFLHLLRSFSF